MFKRLRYRQLFFQLFPFKIFNRISYSQHNGQNTTTTDERDFSSDMLLDFSEASALSPPNSLRRR